MRLRLLPCALALALALAASTPALAAPRQRVVGVSPAAGLGAAVGVVSPAHPFRPRLVPTPSSVRADGRYYSVNWGGFIDGARPSASSPTGLTGTGARFDSVSASWRVARLDPSATTSYMSAWVGIGGAAGGQGLLQAGTIAATAGAQAQYVAFIEDYPNVPLVVEAPVAAGDALQVTVGAPHTVQVSDLTRGWTTGSLDVRAAYAGYGLAYAPPDTQTAEWIVEDPWCGSAVCPFARFTPERFGMVRDHAATPAFRAPLESVIVDAQGQQQVQIAPATIGGAFGAQGAYRPFSVARQAPEGRRGPQPPPEGQGHEHQDAHHDQGGH